MRNGYIPTTLEIMHQALRTVKHLVNGKVKDYRFSVTQYGTFNLVGEHGTNE